MVSNQVVITVELIIPLNLTTDRGALFPTVVIAPAEPRGTADAEEADPARPRRGTLQATIKTLLVATYNLK